MILDDQLAAVVTGGASGLGAATVRALVARGARAASRSNESGDIRHYRQLGRPEESASPALLMIETGHFKGEHVRLDGAIRMASR